MSAVVPNSMATPDVFRKTKRETEEHQRLFDRYILAVDVESGDTIYPNLRRNNHTQDQRNGALMSIGFCVMHLGTGEVMERFEQPMPFLDSDMSPETRRGFWMNEETFKGIRAYFSELQEHSHRQLEEARVLMHEPRAMEPSDHVVGVAIVLACRKVADWLDLIDMKYKPWLVSDFPEFDVGILNMVLSAAGRDHAGFQCKNAELNAKGRYSFERVAIHTDSFARAICSANIVNVWGQDGRALDRYHLKAPAAVVHDHHPSHDAESLCWTLHALFKSHYVHLQRVEPLLNPETGMLPEQPAHLMDNVARNLLSRETELLLENDEVLQDFTPEEKQEAMRFVIEDDNDDWCELQIKIRALEQDLRVFAQQGAITAQMFLRGKRAGLDKLIGFPGGAPMEDAQESE